MRAAEDGHCELADELVEVFTQAQLVSCCIAAADTVG